MSRKTPPKRAAAKRERTLDLDSRQYAILKRLIEQHLPHNEVWAYGSRAKWNAAPNADLDLVVFGADWRTIARFKDDLEESDMIISVDVMDWERIPESFKENIKRKYVVVQKKAAPLAGWREVKLGDIGSFFGGVTSIKKSDYGYGYPFLQYTNVYKNSKVDISDLWLMNVKKSDLEKRNCLYGDIFFTASSETSDEVAISSVLLDDTENLTYNGFCKRYRLHDFNTLLPEFARYFFRGPKFRGQINQIVTGDTRFNISQGELADIAISIPAITEQKKIADVLSSLDDKIDLLRRQNKTLAEMAQVLFSQWRSEGSSGKWTEHLLKDIYTFERGTEPGSKSYEDKKTDKNIRFIRVGDMLNNTGANYVDANMKTVTCENTDLLVSFDGTVGKVAYGISGAYSSGIRKIHSDDKVYNSFGLKYLLFTSKPIQNTIREHATGSVILHASSSIEYLSFNLPPKKEVAKFNDLISPFFDKMLGNLSQIQTLEQTRDTLLPSLMNGTITV